MEFWGVEVKSGKPLAVKLDEDIILHVSQASLGETTEGTRESVCLHIVFEGKKIELGILDSKRQPQQLYRLSFDKDFEISHDRQEGSVFLYGYKTKNPDLFTVPESGEEEEASKKQSEKKGGRKKTHASSSREFPEEALLNVT